MTEGRDAWDHRITTARVRQEVMFDEAMMEKAALVAPLKKRYSSELFLWVG